MTTDIRVSAALLGYSFADQQYILSCVKEGNTPNGTRFHRGYDAVLDILSEEVDAPVVEGYAGFPVDKAAIDSKKGQDRNVGRVIQMGGTQLLITGRKSDGRYQVVNKDGTKTAKDPADLGVVTKESVVGVDADEIHEGLKQARKNIGMDPNKPSCWKGYKAKGTKTKGGKEVPDCQKEDVEEYIDFLIDEGYDCSDLTWDEVQEEYESLDEGLRSAVKKLLGKNDKPAEKKPESRGAQLRKRYNVGPEKSDTSAKRQILDRTRARKERDEKEYGGSHYSKSVAKKSADAHDRYLRAGYSKYGADDRRGSGNKARKRAAALKKESYDLDEALTGERYKKAVKKPGGTAYSRMVSADPKKRATRGGRGGESDFGAGDRGSGNKAARRAGTYQEEFEAFIEEFIDFNDPELDTLTFEELELIAEEALLELDQEEGLLAEALEIIDAMTLLSEGYYDSAVASSKAAAKTPEARAGRRNLRKEKMKAAVKSAASNIKKGAEKAGSAAGTVAGKAVNAAGAAKDAVKAGASKVGSAAGKAAGAVGSAAGKAASGAKKVARGAGEVAGAAAGGFASGYAAARAKRTGSASTQSSTGSASTQASTASKPSSSDSSSTNQSNRPRLRDRIKAGLKRAIGGAARSVSRGARNVARRMGESYSWRDAISYTQVDETSGEQE